MDESLERIIRQALDDARAKGRDHLTQTQVAVEAVTQLAVCLEQPVSCLAPS